MARADRTDRYACMVLALLGKRFAPPTTRRRGRVFCAADVGDRDEWLEVFERRATVGGGLKNQPTATSANLRRSDNAESFNLREAAFHEAGHAVVADALLGRHARIDLWRVARDGNPWIRGSCTHWTPTSLRHAYLIALAGAVAETQCGPHRYSGGRPMLQATLSRISPSDATNAGRFDVGHLDETLALVRSLWPQIEARARFEIEQFNQRAGVPTHQSSTLRCA